MTERIDLDDLDVAADDEDESNPGDWFWRDDGVPADEPGRDADGTVPADAAGDGDEAAADAGTAAADAPAPEDGGSDPADGPAPHVPWETKDRPVGIPKESGGAGGESARGEHAVAGNPNVDGAPAASGPHGGGVDDMTLALTYRAMERVAEPLSVVRDAKTWTDWIGIVGEVDSHVINTFQRTHNIDADFFNGSGQTPGERLADVDEHSMFYADRMVLVGLPDETAFAEAAGWEFVPLSDAAEKADWELADGDGE